MSRKNTILIAIFINTGLLALLLLAALTMQEPKGEEMRSQTSFQLSLPELEEPPLNMEMAIKETLQEPLAEVEQRPLYQLPELLTEKEESFPPKEKEIPAVSPPPVAKLPSIPSVQPSGEVVVKKGDSLEKIARAQHTSVDAIIRLNQLPSTFLKVGQILKIPKEKVEKVSEKRNLVSQAEYYTIKVGENPWAIARKHQMKVSDLLKLNNLNEEKARKLKAGDRLRIR